MSNMPQLFYTTSKKLKKLVDLPLLLGGKVEYWNRKLGVAPNVEGVFIAWGRKPSAKKVEKIAQELRLPVWYLEDGFIHSLGQGVLGSRSWSLVVDRSGIYYDATQTSELENLLGSDSQQLLQNTLLLKRAEQLITLITHYHLSKYNNTADSIDNLALPKAKKVLVVDQTLGDMSLQYGLTNNNSAQLMLEAALNEHPDASVLLKTHPDVIAGKKRGCFDLATLPSRVQVISQAINPMVLLHHVEQVYVLTSQLGFEALMLGKTVHCFGMPFYAGWGLTQDRLSKEYNVFQRRTRKHSINSLFAAAYLIYTRYVHPDTGSVCELEDVVEYLIHQKKLYQETQGRLYCFGFTAWKRNYIRRFLYAPSNELVFVWNAAEALKKGFNEKSPIVVWGERAFIEAQKLSENTSVPIWRVEDGFIRSVGLGSDYTPPLSLVLDKRGIYYDPQQESDLEYLLNHTEFSPVLMERAQALRQLLISKRLSKYNTGLEPVREQLKAHPEQRVLLVIGQVEDDASIRKACIDISTNSALLVAVRQQYPDAYIVFKPHPDVASGNRKGLVSKSVLMQCADLVLEDANIIDCLDVADEVHTLTSLTGFEALLREKPVVCYGLPFYAAWGLTTDRHTLARRQRRITLDELVAATFILYPRYINWHTGHFTTPEQVLDSLQRELQAQGGRQHNKMPSLKRWGRKAINLYRGFVNFRY